MASLEKRFHELHNQFVSEVTTDGKVTVYMMLQALTMLPIVLKAEYNESVQQKLPVLEVATSLQGLFYDLTHCLLLLTILAYSII